MGNWGETEWETGRGCSVCLSEEARSGAVGSLAPFSACLDVGRTDGGFGGRPTPLTETGGVIWVKAVLRPLEALERPGSFGLGTWGR